MASVLTASGRSNAATAARGIAVEIDSDLTAATCDAVHAYLARCDARSGACGEHDPRWLMVLRDGLGHTPYMLIARKGGDAPDGVDSSGAICGYLPLALVASRFFGRFLVSLPYLNRAGIVADDAATAGALIDRAVELAEAIDAQYLDLRHQQPIEHEALNAQVSEKMRMVMPLKADPEFLWKTLPAKVRNQVRKGEQQSFTLQWGGGELVDDFYDVFSVNMRDLGTPVYGRDLFAQTLLQFKDRAELCIVRKGDRAIAGALLVHDQLPGGVMSTQVPSASCLRQFNRSNANMWMYYHLLERAIARGSEQFDFGRSSVGSGTYKFKKQWGAHGQATTWQYHVRRGAVGDVRPDNPRYRRRIEMWQKMPVWLTKLIGPRIIRGIP